MSDPGLENLLANLRRQTTMSSSQQGIPQLPQHQQQQQQSIHPTPGHMYPQPPPPQLNHDSAAQHPPFHTFPHQQQFPIASSVYSPMHHPQSPTTGYADSSFPGFQPMPPQPPMQAQEPMQQSNPPTQAPAIPTSSQPPYNSPMSPSASSLGENRTASLLSLLKFSQPVPPSGSSAPESASQPAPQNAPTPPRPAVNSPPPTSLPQHVSSPHTRSISASDLVASLFGRPSAEATNKENVAGPSASPVQSRSPVQQRSKTTEAVPQRVKSPVNPQDLVFQLLGRTKPVQEEQPSPTTPEFQDPEESSPVAEQSREGTPQKQPSLASSMPPPPPIDSSVPLPRTPLPAAVETPLPSQTPNKGLFTYVNPFEQLAATNPRNRTKTGTPAKNVLGTSETKAENVPLPESKPVSPPAPIEAEAARDAATIDQVKRNEQQLMEQLDQHASEVTRTGSASETMVENAEDIPEPSAPLESPTTVADGSAPQSNGSATAPDVKSPGDDDDDGYESAPENQPIEVYNFPMKPFSAITIVPSAIRRVKYPSVKYQDIARMTRTFDQLDRNLIAASHAFIAYAMSKSNNRGGIRIIRQFDGKDRVLMKDSPDRTFNVTIGKGERLLGTGISGAVVWVELMEDFEAENWNTMFVFPPSEEQGQSNGVLKSRARKTSRLADVFAIGRGKTISIIHAPTAKAYAEGRKNNEVASKRYLADHARTIDTGKASKDFAFSDDDSVIISIDKAGKLKLWDVQGLLNYSENDAYDTVQKAYPPQPPIVLSTPTLVFSAVVAGESYRATSVMFLDKFRPYLKCLALRYVIVGMKQNHTLQLWDLALGRPVQEINFPQESDTDALCSVVYHPLSGIIVVGNPTRNSIYFIHLSAPKYNLPTMSQAQYIKGLATKDPSIPKPDATAILSGLREYSFASKGQLMSIDILDCEADPQEDNPVLFELYVAHSKGMTSLSVYKEDLGWEPDNRVKNAVDAVAKGVCTLSSLPPPPPPEKERDDKSETAEIPAQTLKPKSEKEKSRSASPAPRVAEKSDAADISGTSGAGKRKKKANAAASTATTSGIEDQPKGERVAPVSGKAKASPTQSAEQETSIGISSGFIDRELKKIEKSVSAEFTKVIGKELESLYRRFDDDRRIQQAAGDAKQDAILRLLSSTLTDNVEQVISRIVMTNIQEQVVPAIADVASSSVNRLLGDTLSRSLSTSLPHELRNVVPDAVNRALLQPDLLNQLSKSLTHPLVQAVEREFSHNLHATLIPTFQKVAVDTAQKAVFESERKQNETVTTLQQMHLSDSRKIDQLMSTVKQLSETVSAMAKSQTEFQDQVRQAQADYSQANAADTTQQKSAEQLEADEIEDLLRSGKYEDGTIKWLQSKERQAELFDEVMVRYRYDFLPNLSQLVLLSVSAAVSVKFDHKVMERLSWLEGVLAVLDPMDPEIQEICHRIMVVVVQRLEQLYMSTAESTPQNQILRKIPSIARRARELSTMSQHRSH